MVGVGVNSDDADAHQSFLLSNSNSDVETRRRPPAEEAWVELKKLWQIAGPSIFCRLAMFSLTIITQSLAGHLAQHQLAAISIVTTVFISITFGFLGIWVGMICGTIVQTLILSVITVRRRWEKETKLHRINSLPC